MQAGLIGCWKFMVYPLPDCDVPDCAVGGGAEGLPVARATAPIRI